MAGDDAELVALIDNELDEGERPPARAPRGGSGAAQAVRKAPRDGCPDRGVARRADRQCAASPAARRAAVGGRGPRWPLAVPRNCPSRSRGGICCRPASGGRGSVGRASRCALRRGGDWRSAVAEYMELYTDETFALPNPDRDFQARKLSVVAERVSAALTAENVSLPGLRFESADLLSYEGAPLGEITYVDAHGSPVLFCVIANRTADAPVCSERRHNLSLASWSRGGAPIW
jgi:hypothetical protein